MTRAQRFSARVHQRNVKCCDRPWGQPVGINTTIKLQTSLRAKKPEKQSSFRVLRAKKAIVSGCRVRLGREKGISPPSHSNCKPRVRIDSYPDPGFTQARASQRFMSSLIRSRIKSFSPFSHSVRVAASYLLPGVRQPYIWLSKLCTCPG